MTTTQASSRATDEDPEPPHSVVRLSDGRTLSWTEYGDPNGEPLFFHHGIPSSRVAAAVMEPGAARAGVRLIAPERPRFRLLRPPARSHESSTGPPTSDNSPTTSNCPSSPSPESPPVCPTPSHCALQMPERLHRVALVSGLGAIDSGDVLEGMSYEWRLIYTLFLKSRRLASLWMRGYGRSVPEAS